MPPPSFGADFADHQRPVSNNPSRKQFLTKLVGLVATAGLAPKLLAKQPAVPAGGSVSAPQTIKVQPDTRAIARREGMI
ncbi:MAG: hypothetical protein RLZZ129_2224 [Verrucomicrobiota bacterium]|jgi:hypothetical protein